METIKLTKLATKATKVTEKQAIAKKEEVKKAKREEKKEEVVLSVLDYSDKCFAVSGNSKPVKDYFKNIGRFNPFLKNEKGESFKGWIISKKNQDKLFEVLQTLEQKELAKVI